MEGCPFPEDEFISDTKTEVDDWGNEEGKFINSSELVWLVIFKGNRWRFQYKIKIFSGGFYADVRESSQQDIDEEPIPSCAPVPDEVDPLCDRGSRTRRKRIHEEESDDEEEGDLIFNSFLEDDSGRSSSEDEIPKKGSRSLKKCSRRAKREEVESSEGNLMWISI